MEQNLLEYAANAAWQLPLLAAGGWLLVRTARPGAAAQCRIWTAVLLLAALLPLRGAMVNGSGAKAAQGRVAPTAISPSAAMSAAGSWDRGSAPGAAAPTQPGWWERAANRIVGISTTALDFTGQTQSVRLNATAAWWLAVAFALALLLGLGRIAWAWLAVRRLVSRSPDMALTDAERELVEGCARRMDVDMPEIRVSRGIAGPVTAGLFRPVLLWPESRRWLSGAQDEARAALFHEMAHLLRRDYGMNLLCEVAAAGLRWHPVTYVVERRIHNAREMACDDRAASALGSATTYARSLARLAASMAVGSHTEPAGVLSLFNGKVLEERVMRLTETRATMSARVRWARGVAGAAGMLATLGLAGAFHVAPALAQAAPERPQAPVAAPSSPSLPALPKASAVPAVAPVPAPPNVARPTVPAVPAAPTSPSTPAASPTPAAQARMEAQIAAATAKLNDPKFRAKIEAEQRKAMKAERRITSKEIQKQMAEAQKQLAASTAKLDSPAFREQAQREIWTALNSRKIQRQMAEAQKQLAASTAKLDSPAFREQAQREVWTALNSRKIQKQMAAAQKQLATSMAKLDSPAFREQVQREMWTALNSRKIQKQMAEAQKQLSKELQQMQTGRQP